MTPGPVADPSPAARSGSTSPLLLFDGVCNLCNSSVQFVIKRDPAARIRFAPLQSDLARELLVAHGLPPDALDTMVLVEDGVCHTRSDAALRIARHLRSPWPMLRVFRLVPRPVRNGIYGLIARNRYRLFGRREACMMPTDDVRARFVGGEVS